jgi:mRNA interferase MazF
MPTRRGEIYWVEYNPVRGSEQGGLRPALVVQHDLGNALGETTVVAAITRTRPRRDYPFIVFAAPAQSGLPETSVINCTQLATIQQSGPESRLRPPRGETVVRPIGKLDEAAMRLVDAALLYNLGLE